ncbi:MAG: phenylalanine--tRNA ligase subunit beta [Candidatus Izemoplasmatales bacterium]
MKVSIEWLKEYATVNVQPQELEKAFSLKSAEVASLEKLVDASNLVIGHVLTCTDHPDSDHLHVCEVNTGANVLQIICGAPNVEVNQKVIVALDGALLPGNFKIKKAKIRGVESNGMICSLEELGIEKKYHNEDGIHVLSDEAVPGGNPLEYLSLEDYVMDLELTPNRSDLLSMIGVAYDTKAILNTEVHLPKVKVNEVSEENTVSVFTETAGCKSYYARVVKDVKITESPTWLKARLIASGIRPINNVVDISNYVMLEYGQPLHFFDYDRICTNRIVVRDAIENETIQTLDGKIRNLVKDDLVITDGEKAIALAGVMGGYSTEVEPTTTSILIESATFDSRRIRLTSRRLDLRSEASMRFERGLDPARSILACDRAASLLEVLAGGKTLKGVSYFDMHNYDKVTVSISLEKIIHTTGAPYTVDDIKKIFDSLSFDYKKEGNNFEVEIPSRRQDIKTAQDLIEEIVRIHGYDFIPTTYPKTPTEGGLTTLQKMRRKVRNYLSSVGLDETVTYTLVSKEKAVLFDQKDLSTIHLQNPMSEEKSSLRHSLLPSMLDVVYYNQSRKVDEVKLFELGRVYSYDFEREVLSGVLTGHYQTSLWQGKKETVDFFTLKGLVEGVLQLFNLSSYRILPFKETPSFLHPGQSAEVCVGNDVIGFIGKLHPAMESNYDLKNIYVFELDFASLMKYGKSSVVMKSVPKYPSVSRDIAFVVSDEVSADELTKEIKKTNPQKLIQVTLFDLFKGGNVEAGYKSVAYNLIFQDSEKTLSTEEVDQAVDKVLKTLEKKFSASLRQ